MCESFDKAIVIDLFQQVVEHLDLARKSFDVVSEVNFFSSSHIGKEKLASICMFLMVVGEQIRKSGYPLHSSKFYIKLRQFCT